MIVSNDDSASVTFECCAEDKMWISVVKMSSLKFKQRDWLFRWVFLQTPQQETVENHEYTIESMNRVNKCHLSISNSLSKG